MPKYTKLAQLVDSRFSEGESKSEPRPKTNGERKRDWKMLWPAENNKNIKEYSNDNIYQNIHINSCKN